METDLEQHDLELPVDDESRLRSKIPKGALTPFDLAEQNRLNLSRFLDGVFDLYNVSPQMFPLLRL